MGIFHHVFIVTLFCGIQLTYPSLTPLTMLILLTLSTLSLNLPNMPISLLSSCSSTKPSLSMWSLPDNSNRSLLPALTFSSLPISNYRKFWLTIASNSTTKLCWIRVYKSFCPLWRSVELSSWTGWRFFPDIDFLHDFLKFLLWLIFGQYFIFFVSD